jgi:steroid 5-alpha reductase family enzyme
MSALPLLGLIWGLAAVLMALMWWLQKQTRNASLVDVAWAGGMGISAILCGLLADGDPTRRFLVAVLAALWSYRLAWHIFNRVHGREEDGRYQHLRNHWHTHIQLNFFFFYQAQALAIAVFSIPFLAVAYSKNTLPVWAIITAVLIWLIAVVGEGEADRQLDAWKADPNNRGRTCRAGLWRYSRHPNYFFEWLHWWTYLFLAVGSPVWWLTLIGPVLMLFLLLRITGIPYTERQALESRGEDYRAYQRTTSAFIPWFPDRRKLDANRQ